MANVSSLRNELTILSSNLIKAISFSFCYILRLGLKIKMMNKTIPKDKSSFVYIEDSGRDLISTKPLLVFYQMTLEKVSFKRAQYVHSKNMWIDWEGFQIYEEECLGWIDPMSLINL